MRTWLHSCKGRRKVFTDKTVLFLLISFSVRYSCTLLCPTQSEKKKIAHFLFYLFNKILTSVCNKQHFQSVGNIKCWDIKGKMCILGIGKGNKKRVGFLDWGPSEVYLCPAVRELTVWSWHPGEERLSNPSRLPVMRGNEVWSFSLSPSRAAQKPSWQPPSQGGTWGDRHMWSRCWKEQMGINVRHLSAALSSILFFIRSAPNRCIG